MANKSIKEESYFKNFQKYLNEDSIDDLNQIVDLPVQQFVDKFKNLASDPKVQAVINAGHTDANPKDEVITFSQANIDVKKLKPTQNEIGMDESLKNIITDKFGTVASILKGGAVTIKAPIISLNGEWIIDGHHRWSQVYAGNPECQITAYDMKANIDPETALKAVQMAIAADAGKLPLVNAKGTNMLAASADQVQQYVESNGDVKVAQMYKDAGKIKNADLPSLGNVITANVMQMQKTSQPMPGAPPRSSMPQTDDAPGFADKLKQGMVNFIDPKASDVKKESKIQTRLDGMLKESITKTKLK
jgi:hypothetical protein